MVFNVKAQITLGATSVVTLIVKDTTDSNSLVLDRYKGRIERVAAFVYVISKPGADFWFSETIEKKKVSYLVSIKCVRGNWTLSKKKINTSTY
jgi:hypothetical protein